MGPHDDNPDTFDDTQVSEQHPPQDALPLDGQPDGESQDTQPEDGTEGEQQPTDEDQQATPVDAPEAPVEPPAPALFADQTQASTDAPEQDPAEEPEPIEANIAPAHSFGLIFQAPDPAARAPRRDELDGQEQDGPSEAQTASGEQDSDGEDGGQGAGGKDDSQDSDTPARSRRRGGRGRRARKETESGDGDESGEDSGDNAESKDAKGGENSQDSEEQPSRRRTRRRRRTGAAEGTDDPPGTVTKVREPRKERDEVTSIKGSTRLEAKKQRRREGREAGRRRTVITEAEFLARRESVERIMVVREREGRTQMGVLEDGVLVEHYISRESQSGSMAGNVYLGRVQNVLPSMEAAFVDIGRGRNAVLYAGEVNWDAAGLDSQPKRIEHALKSGESVLVQVTKDPIGHKGARLTSQISLPGRFLVYVPGNSMTGISRKLPDTERSRLKKILKDIVPDEAGVIVRTAAEGASEEDLAADIERLQRTWESIQSSSKTASAPSLLHGEPDLTVRVIRDVFNEDFSRLVVSGDRAWKQVSDYLNSVAPDLADRAEKWTGDKDVFAQYRIDESLAKAMDRKVWLPSGGSLIIDRTEAMTVIDVNTGKFVGSGGNLEETVTKNNLEAAEEIVRQLRLRDIGGIIVVDFIDMVLESNRDLVVRRLLECLGRDRTKHQVAEVTSLGLVQMTRKRVGSGLIEVFSEPCEHCNGRGIIVHSELVDKGNGGSGNGGGNGQSGNSRGRGRGRGRKDEGNGNGSQESATATSGPTAAQIAAAAHAAAQVASTSVSGMPQEDEPLPVDQPSGRESEADVSGPTDTTADGTTAGHTTADRTNDNHAADDHGHGDQSAGEPATPAPAPGIPQQSGPKRRHKRKRVVAPAGPPQPVEPANE